MTDWNQVILQALEELDSRNILTRGAKLRDKVAEIVSEQGTDLQAYLSSTDQRFVNLLDGIPEVVVHKRPGTDMYVGFQGAAWPAITGGESRKYHQGTVKLRQDLYDALTRISERIYYYVPSQDVFTQDPAEGESTERIALPPVTLDDLLTQRREFATQQTTDDSTTNLLNAIDHSPNPLAEFQISLSRLRLGRAWHLFKANSLKNTVDKWAQENEIPVSPSWVGEEWRESVEETPQRLMARFAGFMTEEEIRATLVPFRAVEAMIRELPKGKSL